MRLRVSRRTVLAAIAMVLPLACGRKPPEAAVAEATRAVTANPQLALVFGSGYTATYREDQSLQSSSVGTRVEFDLAGARGTGHAYVQMGLPPASGPWVADRIEVTQPKPMSLRRTAGGWITE